MLVISSSCAIVLSAVLISTVEAQQDGTRVEFLLYNFTNSGKLQNGDKCRAGSPCDPKIRGYVDTINPDGAYPGSEADVNKWATIWEGTGIKSTARLNKLVSRDICRGAYTKATLRGRVDDVGPPRLKLMEQFMCFAGKAVQKTETAATWSRLASCQSYHNKENKIWYSWRTFTIPGWQCGKSNVVNR